MYFISLQQFRYIEFWFNSEDLKRAVKHIRHVSIQEAYKQILHELFTMDDRFYAALNARNLKRCSTGKDWREFAVPGKSIFFQNKDQKLII